MGVPRRGGRRDAHMSPAARSAFTVQDRSRPCALSNASAALGIMICTHAGITAWYATSSPGALTVIWLPAATRRTRLSPGPMESHAVRVVLCPRPACSIGTPRPLAPGVCRSCSTCMASRSYAVRSGGYWCSSAGASPVVPGGPVAAGGAQRHRRIRVPPYPTVVLRRPETSRSSSMGAIHASLRRRRACSSPCWVPYESRTRAEI